MDMSRFLIGRIAGVSALILVAAFAFALWRAQFDVEHESLGAAEAVAAFEQLSALQDDGAEHVDQHLDALRAIAAGGRMRHLQLRVDGTDGESLVAPAPAPGATLVERAFVALLPPDARQADATTWTIRRADGRRFTATFMLNPASEQEEALEDTLGLLGMLFGYAVLTLLAVTWAVRRALAPLQPIHAAIAHYRRAEYAWRVPPLPMRELDAVGSSLNHMAGALADAQEVRRTLSLKLLTLQEDERARIARELHDEFGQVLTAMRADAAWLLRQTEGQAEVQAVTRELAAHCERIQGDVRDLLRELRPQDARFEGAAVPLRTLLEGLLRGWRDRPGQSTRLALRLDAEAEGIADDLALALYRMTQEALTNAMRHARAGSIEVAITRVGDGVLEWRVEDDGIGVDDAARAIHRGNGLAGISERVWAHHGEITIEARDADPQRPGLRLHARFRNAFDAHE